MPTDKNHSQNIRRLSLSKSVSTGSAYDLYNFRVRPNPVILFDGVCNLCNGTVNWVIDRDPKGQFKLAALQSDEAKLLLEKYGWPAPTLDNIALIEDGKFYQRSTAALRIARRLSGMWPLLYGFIVIPPFIRNILYDWIARNRYRWFGKQEVCRLPTPELRQRFLVSESV